MIYLDHAATTPLAPEALEAMSPYLGEQYGNPASIYGLARGARRAIDDARESLADMLGCRPGEIVFTSGGTEADNLAIKGVAWANRARGQHLVTTRIEHLAVLRSCEYLQKLGFEVSYVDVDAHGRVDPAAVEAALRPDTTLVSVILANNEVGTIEPIRELSAITRARGVPLHTDACQAAGALGLDVDAHPNISSRYGVLTLPTTILFEGGEPRATLIGARPRSHYERALAEVLPAA
jgi:cysteine desulfurase